jgi:hypothetical protein
VRVAVAPATSALVVDVAADFTLAVGLDARERTSDGLVGETLAGGTLSAGRLVAGAGEVSGVEVVTAATLLVVEATVVVAVETTAFVVAATVETAFVVVVAAVDATESATGASANRAPHDCAGENAAAISTPAAIGPDNDLVLTCLMGPPQGRVFSIGAWSTPNQRSYSWDVYGFVRTPPPALTEPSLAADVLQAMRRFALAALTMLAVLVLAMPAAGSTLGCLGSNPQASVNENGAILVVWEGFCPNGGTKFSDSRHT